MEQTNERICPGCGRPVIRIRTAVGRVVVDAEPEWIRLASGGDSFITIDGRTVFGHQAGDADDDPDANFLEVHTPHRIHCANNGRRPRTRHRPSGYR